MTPTATPTAGLIVRRDPLNHGDFDLFDAAGAWYGSATDMGSDAATAEANARLWAGAEALMRTARAILEHEGAWDSADDVDGWKATYTALLAKLERAVTAVDGEREAAG